MIEASISTVVTPAGSHDLTTLTTVKAELAIPNTDTTKDAFLAQAITQSSAIIASYCSRIFQVEALQDIFYIRRGAFPWRPAPQADPLQLARWPITTITSAVQTLSDGTTNTLVEDTDFKLDATRGWLYRLDSEGRVSWSWEPQILTVQYSAGYATIPDDLSNAVLRLVTARFWLRGRDPMLISEGQPELGAQRYWVDTRAQNGALPPEIESMVHAYRVPIA